MSYQNENIGMMDEGYFVPRGQILNWLNNLLALNLTKIEQLGSGAVYCQVIDVIHPGKISLSKVNWKAKNDYEFINNLKLLQTAFDKIGIKRYVEVEKLSRAKYQDNLEFIQWLKRYFDLNCGDRGNNYLAEEKRGGAQTDFSFAEKNIVPKTYNGVGVVIPKSNVSPPKKKEPTNSKKEEVQAHIKKEEQPKPKPIQTKLIPPAKPKKTQKSKQKEDKSQQQSQKVLEYKQKVHDLQMKMNMITEIMNSEDQSELKLSLIQQVLQMAQSDKDETL